MASDTHPSNDFFTGKVIAITGAASGMGFAIAKLLAQRGAKVSLADVSEDGLLQAAEQLENVYSAPKENITTYTVDVRDRSQVGSWLDHTIEKFGRLDGAANFAGILDRPTGKAWFEEENDNWDAVIGINLTGIVNCMKAELARMKSGGAIVNASSVAGLCAAPSTPAYAAAKHGVVGLTKCVAKWVSKDVRVNAVAPGLIDTAMVAQFESANKEAVEQLVAVTPLQRRGLPEDVAKLTAFLLSDEASFVHGSVYTIDGGLIA